MSPDSNVEIDRFIRNTQGGQAVQQVGAEEPGAVPGGFYH